MLCWYRCERSSHLRCCTDCPDCCGRVRLHYSRSAGDEDRPDHCITGRINLNSASQKNGSGDYAGRVAEWITFVRSLCQSASRHIPTNWGPQKLLVAMAAQRPVAAAVRTPTSQSSLIQPHSSRGQSL